MNTKYFSRILPALTLSLCMGVIFTSTAGYAAGAISPPPVIGPNQNKVCEDTFNLHKTEIEGMIAAGNNAGVKAIFDKAGCNQVALKVSGSQDKMASKVRCTFTLIPPAIICTFGVK